VVSHKLMTCPYGGGCGQLAVRPTPRYFSFAGLDGAAAAANPERAAATHTRLRTARDPRATPAALAAFLPAVPDVRPGGAAPLSPTRASNSAT
jgi:hypothetical protein